jgi:flagellar assembly factor FliW
MLPPKIDEENLPLSNNKPFIANELYLMGVIIKALETSDIELSLMLTSPDSLLRNYALTITKLRQVLCKVVS